MKNDKLIPGMILVMIGAIFLLNNFGYIHFHWRNLIFMWPVFLVIGGVNLVLSHNRSPWASVLKIAVVVGGFALILFGNFNNRGWWSHATWHTGSVNVNSDDNDDNDDDNNSDNEKLIRRSSSGDFNQPYDASIKLAKLNINGGATTYKLDDTTDQLFKANAKSSHGEYELLGHKEDSTYAMDFNRKDNGFHFRDDDDKNNGVYINLNTKPKWEIEINAGAADVNLDLSKYKMKSVKLNGGAASFKLKMGQPLEETHIDVSSAAVDLNIEIPKDAACSIESTGLSSDDFPGFIKQGNGNYETANFASAKNKMYIHMSGLAASFNVHTY